jgi:hypothetical protein
MSEIKQLASAVDAAIDALAEAAEAYLAAQHGDNHCARREAHEDGRGSGPGIDPGAILRAAVGSKPILARHLSVSATNPPVTIAGIYPA